MSEKLKIDNYEKAIKEILRQNKEIERLKKELQEEKEEKEHYQAIVESWE